MALCFQSLGIFGSSVVLHRFGDFNFLCHDNKGIFGSSLVSNLLTD